MVHPEIEFEIKQSVNQLLSDKVSPWIFLPTGKMKAVKDFYGREICYRGQVGFVGSPREVFWNGFIEPFLEALIIKAFRFARDLSKERGISITKTIKQTRSLLVEGIATVYGEMQGIDQRLCGRGFNSQTRQFDITDKIKTMERILDRHAKATHSNQGRAEKKRKGSFLDAVILKPSLYGIGIDLKKILKRYCTRQK